jgi:hypothetical protein
MRATKCFAFATRDADKLETDTTSILERSLHHSIGCPPTPRHDGANWALRYICENTPTAKKFLFFQARMRATLERELLRMHSC